MEAKPLDTSNVNIVEVQREQSTHTTTNGCADLPPTSLTDQTSTPIPEMLQNLLEYPENKTRMAAEKSGPLDGEIPNRNEAKECSIDDRSDGHSGSSSCSGSSDRSNTGSGVSSIQTTSRSVTPKDVSIFYLHCIRCSAAKIL